MIIVSACLLGKNCTYDGGNNYNQAVCDWLKDKQFIAVCPEEVAGLPIGRPPAEIKGASGTGVLGSYNKVFDKSGRDVTKEFLAGALKTLEEADSAGATIAILKENSPSCGVHFVFDGTFSHKKTPGKGVTAALLEREGIKILSEKDIEQMKKDT
ncbi:MAG: DUF523 domain-containing protein [Bacillota bacterium]|jgi:uncharacterized protein YbbK (DUF523 family)